MVRLKTMQSIGSVWLLSSKQIVSVLSRGSPSSKKEGGSSVRRDVQSRGANKINLLINHEIEELIVDTFTFT